MSLTGVSDTQPPGLISSANGAELDPFDSVTLVASEPLASDPHLVLVDLFGEPVVVAPTNPAAVVFQFFPSTGKLWRYNDQYTVMLDGLVNLAGNRPPEGSSIGFTTPAPPPLVAEDGFESAATPIACRISAPAPARSPAAARRA